MGRNNIGFFNQLRTRRNVTIGQGVDVQRIENPVILDYQSLGRGLNVAVPASRLPEGYTPLAQNIDINDGDQIVRVPGIAVDETFADDHTPEYMFVLGNPNTGLSELFFIDGSFFGVRLSDGTATTWVDASFPAGSEWVTCVHGDVMVLTNGEAIYTKQPLALAVVPLAIDPARAVMSFAGRVFTGGPDDGTYVPMGVAWTGSSGSPSDLGAGSGFEELLDDTTNGDQIVAMRSINLNVAAILTRNALWMARTTGEANRPADFATVTGGYGAITNATVCRVPGGIAYLAQHGVMVFDGNNVSEISQNINKLLYPLDTSKIAQYSFNFVESRNVLQVLTPTEQYEYSFRFQRWLCQTIGALRAVNTGGSFEVLGGGLEVGEGEVGGWGFDWGESWGESGSGSGSPLGGRALDTTVYLKGGQLGLEQANLQTFFDVPFETIFETRLELAQSLDTVVTTRRLIIEYQGDAAAVYWYMQDANNQWMLLRESMVPASPGVRSVNFMARNSGRPAGLRIVMVAGDIAIGRLQMEVDLRGVDRQGGIR